jgi:capsular polysaccharide biosynthesis protein
MTEQNDDRSLLAHYAAILWRRKWYVVAGVVIAVAVSAVTVKSEAERWSASTKVLISSDDPTGLLSGGSGLSADAAERDASTAANVATSDAVIEVGLRAARIDMDPSDVDLSVSPQTGTDILQFTVEDADPVRATRLAKAMAQGYVTYVNRAERTALRLAQQSVKRRLDGLGDDSADNALRQALIQRETQLETALDVPSAGPSVLPSDVSASKVQPRPKRAILLGLVLGLLAGLAVAGVREALDTRVRGAADVGAALSLSSLGMVRGGRRSPASTESLQNVRTSILGRLGAERPVSLTVTASEGQGVDVASDLAASVARSGESTILVRIERGPGPSGDGDLQGLARAMGDLHNLDTYLGVPNGTPALRVLWGSAQDQDEDDLFTPRRLAPLVAELKHRADVVIVGTPPLLDRHAGAAFAAATDAVVVVVDSDAVPRSRLGRLADAVAGLPGRVLGFVAVGRHG